MLLALTERRRKGADTLAAHTAGGIRTEPNATTKLFFAQLLSVGNEFLGQRRCLLKVVRPCAV
jgi:hypothetical protein